MQAHFRKRLMQTQPPHQTFDSDSQTTIHNRSEAYLKPLGEHDPRRPPSLRKQRKANRSAPGSPRKGSTLQSLRFTSARRKLWKSKPPQPTPQPPQLYSPFIGLKVRRAVQPNFDFHSTYARDEVLNYFSIPAAKNIKKRAPRREEDPKKPPNPAPRVKPKEEAQRVRTREDERASSELSGWKIESECMRQSSALNDHSYQIISNYPSISAVFTQDPTEPHPNHSRTDSEPRDTEDPASELELPEYSLKIVAPSEINSSVKELVSIKVIKDNLPSCSLVSESHNQNTPSKRAPSSHPLLNSKLSVEPTSELKVGSCKYSAPRSKKTYESIPSNKENLVFEEIEEEVPSVKEIPKKVSAKGLRGILDSGKISVNYSEDYVCSQKLDENDGIRVSEQEEARAFKFKRGREANALLAEVIASPVPSMKKDKERKSAVIEKIEQFGSNCKNFFSSLAGRINPFGERISEEEDINESILALRTLHSNPDLDSHCSPRELQVHIREPTLMATQAWGADSLQEGMEGLQERITGTIHEVRCSAKDFSSEVRIALTTHAHQREEFYSEEYLKLQTEETVRQALAYVPQEGALKEVILEEAGRSLEESIDLLLDHLYPSQPDKGSLRDEVAVNLQMLEEKIMARLC